MQVDFDKFPDKLAPAIVQDAETGKVLMLGYMNREAFEQTRTTGKAVFYSRSRQKLWTKGETSGNFLIVENIALDCDADAILIKARPTGAVCHTGADTCFNEPNKRSDVSTDFLRELEQTIARRKADQPTDSYVAKLFAQGLPKISQKVGEEAIEVVIAAQHHDQNDFKNEAADLLFHLLVLIAARDLKLRDIENVLEQRGKQAKTG